MPKPETNPETPVTPEAPKTSGDKLLARLSEGGGNEGGGEVNDGNIDPGPPPEVSHADLPSGHVESGEFGEGLDDEPQPIIGGDGGQPGEGEPSNPWLDQIRGLGFEGVETEEQARERLLQAYQQQQEREEQIQQRMQQVSPLVRYGQEYLRLQNDPLFQKTFGNNQEPSPQQAQEPQEGWWNPPKYDPALISQYQEYRVDPETGETAKFWKENTPADVRASAEAYDNYIRDWQHKLVYNPQEAIGQAIEREFDRLYQERESQRQQQTFTESAIQRFQQENAAILFEVDPVTNRYTNKLSKSGRVIQHFVDQAEQRGVTDPEIAFDYALLKYQAEFGGQLPPANGTANGTNGQAQPPANGQSAPTPEQRNLNHLKRGAGMKRGIGGIPNSGGSVQPVDVTEPPPAPNQNLSIGHRLVDRLKVNGVI